MEASSLGLETRRRRILFRAWHRGMRENDLLLGQFADAQVCGLNEVEIDQFEHLLEALDRDVFAWLTGEVPIPAAYDTPLFRKILAFHTHLKPVHA
jgi:antitoxin CptB